MAWRRTGAKHYLNHWWLFYWRIYVSTGFIKDLWEIVENPDGKRGPCLISRELSTNGQCDTSKSDREYNVTPLFFTSNMAVISTNDIDKYFNGIFQNHICSQLIHLTGILDKLIIHRLALTDCENVLMVQFHSFVTGQY